jgi:hypothetical protein
LSAAAAGAAGPAPPAAGLALQAHAARRLGPPGTPVLASAGLSLGVPFAKHAAAPALQHVAVGALSKLILLLSVADHFDNWNLRVYHDKGGEYLNIYIYPDATRPRISLSVVDITFMPEPVMQGVSKLYQAFREHEWEGHAADPFEATYVFDVTNLRQMLRFVHAMLRVIPLDQPFTLGTKGSAKHVEPDAPPTHNVMDLMLLVPDAVTLDDFKRVCKRCPPCLYTINTFDLAGTRHSEGYAVMQLDRVKVRKDECAGYYSNEDMDAASRAFILAQAAKYRVTMRESGPHWVVASFRGTKPHVFKCLLNVATSLRMGRLQFVTACQFKFAGAVLEAGKPGPLNASSKIIVNMAEQAHMHPEDFLSYISE